MLGKDTRINNSITLHLPSPSKTGEGGDEASASSTTKLSRSESEGEDEFLTSSTTLREQRLGTQRDKSLFNHQAFAQRK